MAKTEELRRGWDQVAVGELQDRGLSREHACVAVGVIAEHRQLTDREGYWRGYEHGVRDATQGKQVPTNAQECPAVPTDVPTQDAEKLMKQQLQKGYHQVCQDLLGIIEEAKGDPGVSLMSFVEDELIPWRDRLLRRADMYDPGKQFVRLKDPNSPVAKIGQIGIVQAEYPSGYAGITDPVKVLQVQLTSVDSPVTVLTGAFGWEFLGGLRASD